MIRLAVRSGDPGCLCAVQAVMRGSARRRHFLWRREVFLCEASHAVRLMGLQTQGRRHIPCNVECICAQIPRLCVVDGAGGWGFRV
jgi:hypothetical protein